MLVGAFTRRKPLGRARALGGIVGPSFREAAAWKDTLKSSDITRGGSVSLDPR